jgi:hypothetical protein
MPNSTAPDSIAAERFPFARRARPWLSLAVLLALVNALSSCVVTGLVVIGYYSTSGGLDHDARVAQAWRGPQGELALALEDLEGVCRREQHVLVITAAELEQAFAAPAPKGALPLPIAHVRLPRAVLTREFPLTRPAPDSESRVPAEAWDPGPHEVEKTSRYALPDMPAGAPLAVHWTHDYYVGAPGETGFALLVTRTTDKGVQQVVFLPEAFEAPAWANYLVPVSLAADVLWIVLVFA